MRRSAAVAPLIGAALVLLVAGGCAGPAALTKGPYIQNPSATAMTVQWETSEPGSAKVLFRPAADGTAPWQAVEGRIYESVPARATPSDNKLPREPRTLYRARLLNLEPGTEYAYRVAVGADRGPIESDEHCFRTWPATPPDRVTFIAYGDTRSQPRHHRDLIEQFDRFDPAFILHNGDFVGDGNQYDLWGPEFFEPLGDVIDHVPLLVARGNHEEGTRCMYRFFDMPEGRLNYSFDYGPVHVVMLDMDKPTPEVLQWLAEDLAAATAPWKLAMYHKPMFNLEGHKSDEYRTTFLPLFEKYGVDFVVSGHTHHYERFFPMVRAGEDEGRPITFITAGGGGAPLYPAAQGRYLAKAVSTYSFCVFEVTRDALSVTTWSDKRVLLDAFTVKKEGGRLDGVYLADVRPMEPLMMEQGLSKAGASVKSKAPLKADEPIEIELKAAFPGMKEPVALSVELSAASRKYYRMAPALGWALPDGKEVVVSVFVREIGKRPPPPEKPRPGVLSPDFSVAAAPPKVDKKPKWPDVKLLVTARAGDVERMREMPGIGFNRTSRPAAKWPGPWAEHSDKKPAPVGVTYKAPVKEKKKEEPKKPTDETKKPADEPMDPDKP